MFGPIRSYSIASNADNPGIIFGTFCTGNQNAMVPTFLRVPYFSTISTSNGSHSSRVTVTPDRAMPNPCGSNAYQTLVRIHVPTHPFLDHGGQGAVCEEGRARVWDYAPQSWPKAPV
jgi:hypothetical protein